MNVDNKDILIPTCTVYLIGMSIVVKYVEFI